MAQTVIGFFERSSDAQRAVEKLAGLGCSRDQIDISSGGSAGTSTVNDDRSYRENGVTRFFKSLFGDNDEADRYSRVGNNSILVTVHAQSRAEAERFADLLDECGAIDVEERASGYSQTSGNEYGGDTRRSEDLRVSDDRSSASVIPRIEENLEVGKRTTEGGGARVRSRIVEKPVEEHVRLREENVNVERVAVNRPVSGNELENFRETEIELTEKREVPVVNKEARVVEEIHLSKDVTERDETVRDTVRNTEVDVDQHNKRSGRDTNSSTDRNSGIL
jgi:stress response protein YsnF